MKKLIGTMAAVAVAFSFSAASAGVYVSGPLPSEFSVSGLTGPGQSGTLPPDPDVFKAQGKASKEGSKLVAGLSKCYSKGAKNVSKGSPSGVDTCLHDAKKGVITKYLAKVAGITPLPPCSNSGAGSVASINPLVQSFNSNLNCQSPSGAFIDTGLF